MINRATCCDDVGVRHMVYILAGYPSAAPACGMAQMKFDDVDKRYETITCVTCVAKEVGLGTHQPR